MKQADLDQIFSESKFRSIAHKNQKGITAGTHCAVTCKKKHLYTEMIHPVQSLANK